MLKKGDRAPDFRLQDDTGKEVSLRDLKGSRVVLYFYPKNDTPGCTKEACAFRDVRTAFRELKTEIYGVSSDSIESHGKFKRKYSLNFPLLSDPGHKLAEAYGAWGEKTTYGKKTTGSIRSTFVIGATGEIERVYQNVKVDGHIDAVLADLGA